MCVSPLRIKNRSLHYDGTQPMYFYVPCGKCYECMKAKRNEWYVRSYYEWKTSACAFFYTLTFNNENLPKYLGKSCFDKRLIQLFIKRLRARLSQYNIKLRYIVTSEFGETYARPHHHALFFLNKKVNVYYFYKIIQESWQYGFVKSGDDSGLITSYRGIQYVVKYVTKDYTHTDDFFESLAPVVYSRYNRLFDFIRHRWNLAPTWSLYLDIEQKRFYLRSYSGEKIENSLYEEFLRKFINKVRSSLNARMPFHLQSSKLGYDYALKEKSRLMLDNKVFAPCAKSIMPYALPRAWKRLFWYDCIENERDGKRTNFVLNEFGKQHYLSTLSHRVEDGVSELINVQLNAQSIDDNCVRLVNEQFKQQLWHFHAKLELYQFIKNCDVDFDILSIYMSVFRDRLIPPEMLDVELNPHVVESSYHDYADYCLTSIPSFDYGKIYDTFEGLPKVHAFTLITWNAHPFFVNYERLAKIFITLQNYFKKCRMDAAFEKERTTRQLRELFNKL